MTDDAARRERALATMDEILPDADMDWADAQEIRSDYGLGFLVGYLAGAREEAALAAEEAKRVELCTTRLVSEYGRRLDEKETEIAALREYVRWRETGGERRMEPLSTEAISAFGRALEEKP